METTGWAPMETTGWAPAETTGVDVGGDDGEMIADESEGWRSPVEMKGR
ncbi:hypothetical protein [Kribbella sp. ALI-6-A]|nr:hypothetical protein [Kribbella sp. ALI-6-A]